MKKTDVTERRIHPRRSCRTKVVFEDETGDGIFYVYSEDISMGGMFLASDIPVMVGSLLFLSIKLPPHKRPLRATGEVIRRAESSSSKSGGMGVRFVGLSGFARKRIEEFLEN